MNSGKVLRRLVLGGLVGLVAALLDVAPAAGIDYQWVKTVSSYGSDGTSTFNTVQAVTVDPSGNVWAANLIGNASLGSNFIKLDGSGNWMGTFGPSGYTIGDGLHSDASGNIWATATHGIVQLSNSGTVLQQISSTYLSTPSDVALDPSGNIWATDWTGGMYGPYGLYKFSSSGTLLGRYGSFLPGPCGLTVDPSGNVWVSDTSNGRIVELANDGTTVLQQFGSNGSGNGQLHDAEKIAFDSAGNLWVADAGNNRIEEFSSTGAYLGQFGSKGTGSGQLSGPEGLAFDAAGNLWVADSSNNRLQEFSPVPEPSSLVLLGFGAVSLLAYAWRRRSQAA